MWISWSFFSAFSRLLVQPVIVSVVEITGNKRNNWKRSQRSRKRIRKQKFLDLPHPLNDIEITNYFNNKPRFNGIFSRTNLPGIKDRACVINLKDKNKNSKGPHWIWLFIDKYLSVYFILELNIFLKNYETKSKANELLTIYFRIQGNNSIVCGLHCIAFIEYTLAGKTLLAYTNLLSPNDYKMNGKIIYKYFKDKCSGTIKSRVQIKKN